LTKLGAIRQRKKTTDKIIKNFDIKKDSKQPFIDNAAFFKKGYNIHWQTKG